MTAHAVGHGEELAVRASGDEERVLVVLAGEPRSGDAEALELQRRRAAGNGRPPAAHDGLGAPHAAAPIGAPTLRLRVASASRWS